MATTPKENFITKVLKAKKGAETAMQNFGNRVRKNMAEDDAAYKRGEIGYKATNPFRK